MMYVLELLVILISVVTIDALKWRDCGGRNATLHWHDIQAPDPVRLKNYKVGAKWTIDKEILPGSYSKVEVWRIMRVLMVPIRVKIPCNNFVTCDYDICRRKDDDNFCMFQEIATNTTCGCPMTPKTVEGYNYEVKLPDVKLSSLESWLTNGLYAARWTWFDHNKDKIGCLEGEANLIVN